LSWDLIYLCSDGVFLHICSILWVNGYPNTWWVSLYFLGDLNGGWDIDWKLIVQFFFLASNVMAISLGMQRIFYNIEIVSHSLCLEISTLFLCAYWLIFKICWRLVDHRINRGWVWIHLINKSRVWLFNKVYFPIQTLHSRIVWEQATRGRR
jgi:hypothetical protein